MDHGFLFPLCCKHMCTHEYDCVLFPSFWSKPVPQTCHLQPCAFTCTPQRSYSLLLRLTLWVEPALILPVILLELLPNFFIQLLLDTYYVPDTMDTKVTMKEVLPTWSLPSCWGGKRRDKGEFRRASDCVPDTLCHKYNIFNLKTSPQPHEVEYYHIS